MARKNLYKINDVLSVDDEKFRDDDELFADGDEYEEEYIKARPDIIDYPDDIDEDDLDYDFKAEYKEARKKRKKTRKEKFRYRGKYELLPERENHKQIRFYRRRFTYMASALITGIIGVGFGFLAFKYNHIFALLTVLIVLPGILWGLFGLINIRTKGLIIIIIGLTLNIIAVIMIMKPLWALIPNLGQMYDLIKDYIKDILI